MIKIRINNYVLSSPKLDKNKKIINMSDIHSNIEALKKIRKILEQEKSKEKVDCICIPGYVVDTIDDFRNEQMIKELSKIGNITKTFISLGNHEFIGSDCKKYMYFFNELSSCSNCSCLVHECDSEILDKDIIINAINMPLSYYEDGESKISAHKFIEKIKLNVEESKFNILLSHTPNWIFKNNKVINNLKILENIDMILCGHNHGGLMPVFLQDIINNHYGLVGPYSKIFQPNAYGTYNDEGISILISNGVTKISETSPLGKVNHILNKIYIPEIDVINMVQTKKHSLKLQNRNICDFNESIIKFIGGNL